MKFIYLIFIALSLLSCNSKTREHLKIIKEWHDKEIIFPPDVLIVS